MKKILKNKYEQEKLLSTQFRPIKDNNLLIQGENILSSSDIISCPATGNGDSDDDVSFEYIFNYFNIKEFVLFLALLCMS